MKYDHDIEQYIYTTDPFRGGSFGVFAQSEGIQRIEVSNFNDMISKCYSCQPRAFAAETRTFTRTRQVEGNILKKIFKRTEEYQEEQVVKNPVTIVAESHSGDLRSAVGHDADFRLTPEKAPFRIIKTKLLDGRTLICRMSAIGRVYSDLDTRQGNVFYHTMIVPAGIELTDQEIANIPFMLGLDKAVIAPNANNPSRQLPKLSMAEITRSPKRKATQIKAKAPVTTDSLVAHFESLPFSEKINNIIEIGLASVRYGEYESIDGRTKMQYLSALYKIVKAHPEMVPLTKLEIAQRQAAIHDVAPFKLDALGDVVNSLDLIETPYSSLHALTALYVRTSREIDKLNAEDSLTPTQQQKLKNKEIELERQEKEIQRKFAELDPSKVLEYTTAEMEYMKLHDKTVGLSIEHTLSDSYYKAARTLSRVANQVLTKNIPVEKTNLL